MEILKIVEALQSYTEDVVAYKLDSRFACAVTEAVKLLVEQGEQLADLENVPAIKINADRFRTMSDREIAEFLARYAISAANLRMMGIEDNMTHAQLAALKEHVWSIWMRWLRAPVEVQSM